MILYEPSVKISAVNAFWEGERKVFLEFVLIINLIE